MADGTVLNAGQGGDTILDEDMGGGVKLPVSKIYLGAHGVNGGPVAPANALPVLLYDGAGNAIAVLKMMFLRG